ncbi:hypothetical protein DXG03_005494 [Asterophora parasitica]|uniref:F-box domain-containing protein n=1 Tax=Asterophora parasitica TaxID=117018 RepID=A0A9P7GER4_9AGAR|nr:hypothetical protein DXG03_005494 [Asterophora parasitica]
MQPSPELQITLEADKEKCWRSLNNGDSGQRRAPSLTLKYVLVDRLGTMLPSLNESHQTLTEATYATTALAARPMFIPPELVREIVAFLFESPRTTSQDELGVSVKHNWSSIQSLSLTSKTYRTLALGAWFRILFIKDPSDINTLQTFFPEIGKATRSLQHLHTVIITIPDFGGGKTALGNDQEHNQNLWAGECDRCIEIMYEDGNFRVQYVARKQGLASSDTFRMVYVPPPALKRVEWAFWRAEGCEEVEVQESGDELSGSDEDS